MIEPLNSPDKRLHSAPARDFTCAQALSFGDPRNPENPEVQRSTAARVLREELNELRELAIDSDELEANLNLVLVDCVKYCLVELCKELLLQGCRTIRANAQEQDAQGKCALHYAVETGQVEVCEVIINYGQFHSLDLTDQSGRTPLHYACQLNYTSIAKLLCRSGAALDVQDSVGNSPAHYAVAQCNDELCKLFVRRDADLHLCNNEGYSVIELAKSRGSTHELCLLNVTPQAYRPAPKILPEDSPSSDSDDELSDPTTVEELTIVKSLRKIGHAEVLYLVKQLNSGRLYAMKVSKLSRLHDKSLFFKYFQAETAALAEVQHPFITRAILTSQDAQFSYRVYDYANGSDLEKLLQRRKSFSEVEVQFLAGQVVLALEALHSKHILYRNLKPKNVQVNCLGYIKLTDFGLAKVSVNRPTNSFFLSTTRLPPEMIKSDGHSFAADWYMLGALLHELAIGKPPFFRTQKNAMASSILKQPLLLPSYLSASLKDLLHKLLEKVPEARLAEAAAIKSHSFFAGLDWTALQERNLQASELLKDDIEFLSLTEELYTQSFLLLSMNQSIDE